MASSSSLLSNIRVKYEVFLSFRGEDTQNNFTSHLHAALKRAKVETFSDENDELIRGEEFSSYLLNAIEESMISVIIFSKRYASSRCCLDELVKILECKKKYGQIVMPVYYHVDPMHVRNQVGTFGDAFAELEKCHTEGPEMLQRWRTALREATNLDGFDSNVIRSESALVEKIVKHILKTLNDMYPSDNKDLVGVQSIIEKIESLLCIELKDVRIVGIWGMSGIGKTTIAKAVFDKIKNQFDNSYFAQNVREVSESPNGLTCLRQELLSRLLKDEHCNNSFTFIKQRLGCKKVLIIFDDVTSLEQIKFLIGDLNCLGLESRIIITAIERQVLENCGVDENNMYEVEALSHHEALQLFSWYAFQQNRPILVYKELSDRIVKYVNGVPLTLKVLGCFLLGRKEKVWKSTIDKLEKTPHKDIQEVLKICYDGLDDDEKNIFLDVACFLKWEDRDFVLKFLEVCCFFAEIGISVLVDKSLITLSENKITMHDLLQQMGWGIVKQESYEDPSRRSRLWHHVDICNVLKDKKGSKAIEGICFDMSKETNMDLDLHAFAEMRNLKFLKVLNSHCEENNINEIHVSHGLESCFNELRYLCWHGYPLKSLPLNFDPENLVALDMPHSNLEQLWTDDQNILNLRSINLSHSKNLVKIPDLSRIQNLEILILEGCTSLFEVSSSTECPSKLAILNLRHCNNLRSLSIGNSSESLKKVVLSCCSNLRTFPYISCSIEELFLDETTIEELPPLIENQSRLVTLNLRNCSRLQSLPSSIFKVQSLENLDLSGCSKLDGLPNCLENLKALRVFKAERFPKIRVLSSLVYLCFLKELNLTDCFIEELPSNLGQLSSVESLLLGGNSFECIPASVRELSKLLYLDLCNCKRLQCIPELPVQLLHLDAHSCDLLKVVSSDLSILFPHISRNARVNFINCRRLNQKALITLLKVVLKKIIEDSTIELFPRSSACICFPGTEIPKWFTFKSTGSSINFKPPSGVSTRKSVHFAVCAIVDLQNYQDGGQGLVVGCDCKLGGTDGSVVLYYGFRPRVINSAHVFLGYNLQMCSFDLDDSQQSDNEAFSVQFYVEDSNAERRDCRKVIKCGIHLLNYQETENPEYKKSILPKVRVKKFLKAFHQRSKSFAHHLLPSSQKD